MMNLSHDLWRDILMEKFFGGKESFVRFFFNNYHFFTQRAETLHKENQQFKIRNNSAQNTTNLNLKQ